MLQTTLIAFFLVMTPVANVLLAVFFDHILQDYFIETFMWLTQCPWINLEVVGE